MTEKAQYGWIPDSLQSTETGLAMLNAVFHGHPDMLFIADMQDQIVGANSVALVSLGYQRQDIDGQSIHMLVPAALRQRHANQILSFSKHPSIRPMGSGIDLSICDAAGNEFPVDVTLWPFSAGAAQYVLAVCRRMDADLAHMQRQVQALVENARGYVVILLDAEGRIRTWNDGAEQMYGLSASNSLGMDHSILFTQTERDDGVPQQQLERARLSAEPVQTEGWRQNAAAERIWAESRCAASRDRIGRITGFTRVLHDLTAHKIIENELRVSNQALGSLAADLENRVSERTRQLEETVGELRQKKAESEAHAETVAHELREKEVLLREVYHRVKNNLQVVQSLLKMRARTLNSGAAQEAIDAAVQRIQVMATVHEHLYQMPDLATLSLPVYLKEVVDGALHSGSVDAHSVDIQFAADEIPMNLDQAIQVGLLVNELVSNCLKHGLEPGAPGQIKVSVLRTPVTPRLVVQDSGCGLPADFDLDQCKSMGLKLANSLAQRLGGQLKFTSDNGCRVEADLIRL